MPRSELPDRPRLTVADLQQQQFTRVGVHQQTFRRAEQCTADTHMLTPYGAPVSGFRLVRIADVQWLGAQQATGRQFAIHLAEQMQITVVISHRQPAAMSRYLAQLAPGSRRLPAP